jgi:hypothetical protein
MDDGWSLPEKQIVLLSYVFGETAANRGFLYMFMESAKSSGVDVAIVGSPAKAACISSSKGGQAA